MYSMFLQKPFDWRYSFVIATYLSGVISMDYKTLLLSAKGRINRKTYWMTMIALAVVEAVVWGIAGALAKSTASEDGMSAVGVALLCVAGVVSLVSVWSLIALAFKRCHDRDMSGWMMLIPLYNMWVQIQMAFLAGTAGPNRFGPDPLGALPLGYAAA